MQRLTSQGHEQLRSIAERYGVSLAAAENLFEAVQRGGGSMAQFNHPDLGGYGQWMRGGMTMVGDMFNNSLKATVDGMCSELSRLLETNPFEPQPVSASASHGGSGSYQSQSSGNMSMSSSGFGWWPAELGQPSSSGSQNDMRYAYFPHARRLAIQQNGTVTVYDTLDHQIGGVSQQQGGGYSLSFSSQLGGVNLQQLPVTYSSAPSYDQPLAYEQGSSYQSTYEALPGSGGSPPAPPRQEGESDVFAKIERLAALKQKGVLTEDEFAAKKAELLARI